VALRDIAPDEELTIDYATCYDTRMTPFDCQCGSPQCRGRIVGIDPMPGHRL
jgi:SET domain-containing protein